MMPSKMVATPHSKSGDWKPLKISANPEICLSLTDITLISCSIPPKGIERKISRGNPKLVPKNRANLDSSNRADQDILPEISPPTHKRNQRNRTPESFPA